MNAGKQAASADTQTAPSDVPEPETETGRPERAYQALPDDEARRRYLPLISQERLRTPAREPRGGEEDRFRLQLLASLSGAKEGQGDWNHQVDAARVQWGKLSDDELLQTRGHMEQLIGLVQERYGITRDEAAAQIDRFFDKHRA